jgi:SSS family solute:Na+ symporter
MAGNFWRSFFAWVACFVITVIVSFFTKPKPIEELEGLVWGTGAKPDHKDIPFYKNPVVMAIVILAMTIACNLAFW